GGDLGGLRRLGAGLRAGVLAEPFLDLLDVLAVAGPPGVAGLLARVRVVGRAEDRAVGGVTRGLDERDVAGAGTADDQALVARLGGGGHGLGAARGVGDPDRAGVLEVLDVRAVRLVVGAGLLEPGEGEPGGLGLLLDLGRGALARVVALVHHADGGDALALEVFDDLLDVEGDRV